MSCVTLMVSLRYVEYSHKNHTPHDSSYYHTLDTIGYDAIFVILDHNCHLNLRAYTPITSKKGVSFCKESHRGTSHTAFMSD